jgi:hypothetical protein
MSKLSITPNEKVFLAIGILLGFVIGFLCCYIPNKNEPPMVKPIVVPVNTTYYKVEDSVCLPDDEGYVYGCSALSTDVNGNKKTFFVNTPVVAGQTIAFDCSGNDCFNARVVYDNIK